MSATPLTDAIQALTTYANETTGASDTTLSAAVGSLVAGYGGGGIDTDPIKIVTLSAEKSLSDILTDTPIPLKYTDEICVVRFYSGSAPTSGDNQTSNCTMFVVRNLEPQCMMSWYTGAKVSLNGLNMKNGAMDFKDYRYFSVSNHTIVSNTSTNTGRHYPSGTDIYALHIPYDFADNQLESTEL